MENELTSSSGAQILEQVIIGGDLSRLSSADRVHYYKRVCDSLGLNPLTKPFDYITLNGKLTLYAKRDCTDQLRKINEVSITIVSRDLEDDYYTVTAQATDKTGRRDESTGVVYMGSLKGEMRSNAMMKAETKSKRRVTLSICGLGALDETEVGSVVDNSMDFDYDDRENRLRNSLPRGENVLTEVKHFLAEENIEEAYKLCESLSDTKHKKALWSFLSDEERTALTNYQKINNNELI